MTSQRTEAIVFAAAVLFLIGVLVATTSSPKDVPAAPTVLRQSYNGTLQGHAGAPANWTLNVTVAPGTHQVDVAASWHRHGPVIHLGVVLANGTTVAGSVPGNYPFSVASVHPGGARLRVILTSEVTEAFELKVEQRTLAESG